MIDIGNKLNIIVLGYGVSGKSIHKFLKEKGHNVLVFEDSNEDIPDRVTNIDWENTDLIVKSPSIPIMPSNCHPIIQEANERNIEVLSTFDIFKLYNPDSKVIAITGTNGKSTTTALTYHILKKAGISVSMGGNIGVPYCELPKSDIYIFEMSSYELASSKCLDFEITAVLNIEPDHLGFHENFENYVAAKHLALDNAKFKIISCEDAITMSKYNKSKDVATVSINKIETANVYVYEGALMNSGIVVIDLSGLIELRGKHNNQNALFAYEICKKLGITPKEIAKNIMSFKALPHRMKAVRKINNVLFINDSKATNPDSAAKALDTFVGYKIFWLVGGRSKKTDTLKTIGNYLASVQKIYLFGESSDEFKETFKDLKKTLPCKTLINAIQAAYKDASKESGPSVVLLSPMCASFDQFRNFEHRGEEFIHAVMGIS